MRWSGSTRANAHAVVKARSIPHKSVRFSKDSALPFMLFGTLDGASLFVDLLRRSEMESHPVFSAKIPASKTPHATSGRSTMRRVFSGLLFFSLTISAAFGGEALAPSSDAGASLEKPSSAAHLHPSRSSKPASRTQLHGRTGQRSLPLSSASAYASEHATGLPISSPPGPSPPQSPSWTGFYVGAGAGAGHP